MLADCGQVLVVSGLVGRPADQADAGADGGSCGEQSGGFAGAFVLACQPGERFE
jgi:hypothetical protein